MNEFLSSARGRVAIAIAVVVILLAGGGGYYFWSQSKSGSTAPGTSIAEAGVCNAVVAQARDYGVLPPDAQKTGEKAVSDNNPNRVTCDAQAGAATFTLIADVPCDDPKNDKCVLLQKVTGANGQALYNTNQI